MDVSASIQALAQSLEGLRTAVHSGSHDEAARLVESYDRDVRGLFAHPISPISIQEITRLLALQHAVMDEMCELRDTAARHLNAGRTSLRAAHAYRKAESLA